MSVVLSFPISSREQTVFLICGQSLWAACGRVIVNEIVARRCIVAEPTTSPEQRDGELRSALEQIQSVMAVPALRCSLMSSSLALSIMLRTAHMPILDRLLPRASPTRMWRNLMVTVLRCPSPWKPSCVRPPEVYLYAQAPLYFATRTEEHPCSLASS